MNQKVGCGFLCGFGCAAGREALAKAREVSDTTDRFRGSQDPESAIASPDIPGSHGVQQLGGWSLVMAATYTLLLPPLILLVAATIWATWLGEGAAVGIGLAISFVVLFPAHRWLVRNSPRCSLTAHDGERRR